VQAEDANVTLGFGCLSDACGCGISGRSCLGRRSIRRLHRASIARCSLSLGREHAVLPFGARWRPDSAARSERVLCDELCTDRHSL